MHSLTQRKMACLKGLLYINLQKERQIVTNAAIIYNNADDDDDDD